MTVFIDEANSTDTFDTEYIDGRLFAFGEPNQANVINLQGTTGASVFGGNLGDLFRGAGGDDVLEGRAGSDLLFGEGGDDAIRGGTDSDNLIAGDGSNIVSGGTGSDLFVFEFFGDAQENTVQDFNAEEYDRIYVEGQGFVDTEGLGIGDGDVTVSFDAEGNVSINGEELTDDDFEMI